MMQQFPKCDKKSSPFRLMLREVMISQRVLASLIFAYASILVILNGYLPATYLKISLTVFTIPFIIFFCLYTKLNGSQEYRKSLPMSPKKLIIIDTTAALVISFPFYAMTALSFQKQRYLEPGLFSSNKYFILQGLGILLISFLLSSWAFNGKLLSGPQAPGLKNFRRFLLLVFIVISALFGFAVKKKLNFYKPLKAVYKERVLIPKSCTEVAYLPHYQAKNPDRYLLLFQIQDNQNRRVYLASKSIPIPKEKDFSISIKDFPKVPQAASDIRIVIDKKEGKYIDSHQRGNGMYTNSNRFDKGHPMAFRNSSLLLKKQQKDSWFKRFISFHDKSIHAIGKSSFFIIPFHSEEELVDLGNHSFLDPWIDSFFRTREHFNQALHLMKGQKVNDNLLKPLMPLYGFYCAFYLMLFILVRGRLPLMFIAIIGTISLMASVDYGLYRNKIEAIQNTSLADVTRSIAAIELQETIYWRKKASQEAIRVLKDLSETIKSEKSHRMEKTRLVYTWLRISQLKLLSSPELKPRVFPQTFDSFYKKLSRYSSGESGAKNILVYQPDHMGINHLFKTKLATQEGIYIVDNFSSTYYQLEVNDLDRIFIPQRELDFTLLKDCLKRLQSNWHDKKAQQILRENEAIFTNFAFNLYLNKIRHFKNEKERIYSLDIIKITKEQQLDFLKKNIHKLELKEK